MLPVDLVARVTIMLTITPHATGCASTLTGHTCVWLSAAEALRNFALAEATNGTNNVT